jgi:hypothetical protein
MFRALFYKPRYPLVSRGCSSYTQVVARTDFLLQKRIAWRKSFGRPLGQADGSPNAKMTIGGTHDKPTSNLDASVLRIFAFIFVVFFPSERAMHVLE